jgi:hypothetical protein
MTKSTLGSCIKQPMESVNGNLPTSERDSYLPPRGIPPLPSTPLLTRQLGRTARSGSMRDRIRLASAEDPVVTLLPRLTAPDMSSVSAAFFALSLRPLVDGPGFAPLASVVATFGWTVGLPSLAASLSSAASRMDNKLFRASALVTCKTSHDIGRRDLRSIHGNLQS